MDEYNKKYFENLNSVADVEEHIMSGEDTILYSQLEFKDFSEKYEEIMELKRQEEKLLQRASGVLRGIL